MLGPILVSAQTTPAQKHKKNVRGGRYQGRGGRPGREGGAASYGRGGHLKRPWPAPPSNKPLVTLNRLAMSHLSVDEQRAMTMDMLIGNVGGILGLFLGVSCLTFVSGVQYLLRIVHNTYTKK